MADLSDLHLTESTAVLRISQDLSQVSSIAELHTYVRGIASGRVLEPIREVSRFDNVWMVEALGQFEFPVPPLDVLL